MPLPLPFTALGKLFSRRKGDPVAEQRRLLEDRERIEKQLAEIELASKSRILRKRTQSVDTNAGITDFQRLAEPVTTARHVSWSDGYARSHQEEYSIDIDSMPPRLHLAARRRNAMGQRLHRKSIMKDFLSVANGNGQTPASDLKEGKKLPDYLTNDTEVDTYKVPNCCHKPLPDPDDFYEKTYIVVNQHGTTFRFSESKSLFLFEEKSRVRQFCINLFIRPLFSHLIMLVILANCVCMMLAEPPTWIDSHLEYVFTAIYCFEAGIKIIGRGFILHRFSYLRDPWNWLDFIVIVFAIITEILKAIMYSTGGESNGELSQLSVLRTFRVLRALKTMSVVPGLRGIVKALLRSIRALQDAVALTIFCVSVFALIGYQLFNGTLRNKCVLIPGNLEQGPDAMYLADFDTTYANGSFLYRDFNATLFTSNQLLSDSVNMSFHSRHSPIPLYNTDCSGLSNCKNASEYVGQTTWTISDKNLTAALLTKVTERTMNISSDATHSSNLDCSALLEECFTFIEFDAQTYYNSSLLQTATMLSYQGEKGVLRHFWGCDAPLQDYNTSSGDAFFTAASPNAGNVFHSETLTSTRCNISVVALAGDISCMYRSVGRERSATNPSHGLENHRCYQNKSIEILRFGELSVERWETRKAVVFFQLYSAGYEKNDGWMPRGDSRRSTYMIFQEYEREELSEEGATKWDCNDKYYIMRDVDGGMYFYANSSNRPSQEPLYCKMGENSVCPNTHECREAGGNPDFGYTSFDHFFWAFLTSFRLINQDAWSRLYYLTLHTIGQTYVIFYIIVMFLGSYYLVNLILAVVYMAYEEQQAAAEDEAMEEEEHKAEKREIEPSNNDDGGSRSKEGQSWSRSSMRSCCVAEDGRSFGLITTSITSIADSGGMRRSRRSSRRQRYGHRRPPIKVDPESEVLYRQYTEKHGDGMSHEHIDNLSSETDQDRCRVSGCRDRIRKDSLTSMGSFGTVSERNYYPRRGSRDDGSALFSLEGYCPHCRSHQTPPLRESKSRYLSNPRPACIDNAVASVDPQIKVIVTPETPTIGPEENYEYYFLAPGQTPKPVGALLINSKCDVLAVDFAPGRSPSIYSSASEGNYEVEKENDDTLKHLPQTANEVLHDIPTRKNISDRRPNNRRCDFLAVPFDGSSQSSISLSSNSEVIDGGEQIVQADVTAPNMSSLPTYLESEKNFRDDLSESNRSLSSREPTTSNVILSANHLKESNATTPHQVPSLMITSASSEHIISLCQKDLEQEKSETCKNRLGVHLKYNLPAIAGSPNLNATDCNPGDLDPRIGDIQGAMSDSGIVKGSSYTTSKRRRQKQPIRHTSVDMVDMKSQRFRFYEKDPESHEMPFINGYRDHVPLSEIAANLISVEQAPSYGRKRRSLKNIAKSHLHKAKREAVEIFCKWSCCTLRWERFQSRIRMGVLDPFMDLFITLCIFLNTFFMMMEYHPAEDSHQKLLEDANLVFTAIFSLEMFFKVIGLGPYTYFRETWNMFDAVVVISSLLEIILQKIPGLSVLRAFRLMRILKLAKSWPTLNKLLRIIGKTLGKLWHLTLVFLLVLFIFAVVGMQLLRENYKEAFQTHMPRWNFVDFPHAFMVVFRIQCGEWIENMFVCMTVAPTGICIPLFILVLIIGNLVILNLFLALLLNSFSGDALQRTDAERNSLAEAWHRILHGIRKGTRIITRCNVIGNCCSKLQLQLCLKQRQPSGGAEKIVAKKGSKMETLALEPSQTETTMLRYSETEFHSANEQRNNNHLDDIFKTFDQTPIPETPSIYIEKASDGSNKADEIVSHSIDGNYRKSVSHHDENHQRHARHHEHSKGAEPDGNSTDHHRMESDGNRTNVTTAARCLGCHKEFVQPNPHQNTHRKRARTREGFAPAAAFQNRPDETNDPMDNWTIVASEVGSHNPRRLFHKNDSIEFTRTSSQDQSKGPAKVDSDESSSNQFAYCSRDRKSKLHNGNKSADGHSVKKHATELVRTEKHSKHSDAEETELLLSINNIEQETAPSRQASRKNGSAVTVTDNRRKSNASVSTHRSASSGRPHRSVSRSRATSMASGEVEEPQESIQSKDGIPFCFPPFWVDNTDGKWWKTRVFFYNVAVHRYFENVVIFCILMSSVALAFEDIHLHSNPSMKKVLGALDNFFCAFFAIEMLIKWTGFGLRYYFTNAWCLLDFVIVFCSLLDMCLNLTGGASEQLGALRVLRTFRALRPLRALSRFEGMKVVVDALVRAIPSIFNVFLVCIIVWLIFSILGVNFFGGRFGRCVMFNGTTGVILPRRDNLTNPGSDINITDSCVPNASFPLRESEIPAVRDRKECEECAVMMNTTQIQWVVPSVNFDNVGQGFLALMQVATFKGWLEIMASAVDITGVEEQPLYEYSFHNYLYFCIFIVFGAFFSLNLFIGVIIDNFNQQKDRSAGGEDGVFLTDEQKRYYNAMKRMAAKAPSTSIPRPNSWFPNVIYNIVTDRKFEMAVMAMILLNMVVMAIEHYDMSDELGKVLENFNLFFICVFFIEAVLKLIGLRLYYFTISWNVFDIIVVVVSVIASALSEMIEKYFVQPTLFRIIRLFRVTRILRLVREAKGIRTLLFALMMSLPALFNIGSLLFLVIFIYAILGMSQFAYVQKIAGVNDILNFETFPNTFLVLFQVSTSEGWNTFIEPILRDKEPFCDPYIVNGNGNGNANGNCGNAAVGVAYFVTFVLITFLIVINMYIAIILENFEVATRESAEPLTADDFEQFFEVWKRYDDKLTQYVTMEQLQHLLHHLDYPLRVTFPNRPFVVNARMKISVTGRVHCLEVIIALIKKVLGDSPELETFKETMTQSFMLKCKTKELVQEEDMIDTMIYERRRQAAMLIQRNFRKWKNPPQTKNDEGSIPNSITEPG